MPARRARHESVRRGAATLVGAALTLCLTVAPSVQQPAVYAPVPATAPLLPAVAQPVEPRIAFTDARDEGVLTGQIGLVPNAVPDPGPVHRGETSIAGNAEALVSTSDQAQGEVYVRRSRQQVPTRVTCNAAVESHPVVSPDGTRVAYASNVSGTFRLWLAAMAPGDELSCDTTRHFLLRGAPGGENLWPTWVDNDRLVFSATGDDHLGDLWAVNAIVTREGLLVEGPAIRLTGSPAAETQPSFGRARSFDGEFDPVPVVAFTTSQFRPDGSLGYVVLPEPPPPGNPVPLLTVHSLWPVGDDDPVPPQSEEGVWSPDGYGLAYTTREVDPYGDVVTSSVRHADTDAVNLEPFEERISVADRPGIAESHAAWQSADDGEPGIMVFTRRSATGDISDVVASDGSGRRTVAADVVDEDGLDESSPTYSPDGARIAYSRNVPSPDGGREIVMADAGGGNVVTLHSGREAGSFDFEPAWSPDGARIAFVRFPVCKCTSTPSEIWVADVATRTARLVRGAVPENTVWWDEHPSWSPDGTKLVIARSVEELHPDVNVAMSGPGTVAVGADIVVTATIRNSGRGSANGVRLELRGPPDGPPEFPSPLLLTPVDDSCSPGNAFTVTCDIARIGAGAERRVTLRVTGVLPGTHDLAASLSVLGEPDEEDTGNNSATKPITVFEPPDVVVGMSPATLTDLPDSPPTRLSVTLRNAGRGPATSVVLSVTWTGTGEPPGVITLAPAGPPCSQANATAAVVCSVGAMAPGATRSVDVLLAGVGGSGFTVRAEVSGVPGEVDIGDNIATVDGTCCPPPEPIGSAVPLAFLRAAPTGSEVRPAAPKTVREAPVAPPADTLSALWVLDVATGAGHELAGPGSRQCVCPVSVPRSPAWSPDGRQVAFEDRGAIYLLALADARGDAVVSDATGRPVLRTVTGFSEISSTEWTPTPSRASISVAQDPAWSPDGKELAFSGQPAGHPDQRGIYRIRRDGTALAVVAQERGPETEPAWQPWADLKLSLVAQPTTVVSGGASTLVATVTNAGPARATGVVLGLVVPPGLTVGTRPAACPPSAGGDVECQLGDLARAAEATVKLPVTGTTIGSHEVGGTVSSPVPDANPANNTTSTTVHVVALATDVSVALRIDRNPGYVGGTSRLVAQVTNRGPVGNAVQLSVIPTPLLLAVLGPAPCFTATPCDLGTLAPGARRELAVAVRFLAAGTGPITGTVTSSVLDLAPTNDVAHLGLVVKQPVLRFLQPIGHPGSVAMTFGQDFPPRSQVGLAWDHGINVRGEFRAVERDGTVRPVQILIFRRDQLGNRLLVATPEDPSLYTPVSTPLLVTPRTVTPPADFVSRN